MIAKKDSRQIIIGGQSYRWKARDKNGKTITLIMAAENMPGQRMIVIFDSRKPGHPKKESQVSPGIVRSMALAAQSQGWQPSEPGGLFKVKDVDQILKTYEAEMIEKRHQGWQEIWDKLERQKRKPPLKAELDKSGWVTCPNCDKRFSTRSRMSWNGEFHITCGRRIRLTRQ
jgi:hypothetical protein